MSCQVLAKLKPRHLKVVGGMAMVRNSVGSGQCDDIGVGVSPIESCMKIYFNDSISIVSSNECTVGVFPLSYLSLCVVSLSD